MRSWWINLNNGAVTLLSLSIILLSGFLMTRLTKLIRLPNVSGFILAGVLIGPCVLGAIPQSVTDGLGFLTDIALAFIAFGVGRFFKRDVIRSAGWRVIAITLAEALAAGALVTLTMRFAFGMDTRFSLLLGAVATATAPASTMMTIKQFGAHGKFVDTLLQVVALDDAVCLLVYSVCTALVGAQGGSVAAKDIYLPLIFNAAALLLGALCGIVLGRLVTKPTRSGDNKLILTVAALFGVSGLCAIFNISPLLCCMVFGAVYRNSTHDSTLFDRLDCFTPPIMSVFFIVSGMNLDLRSLYVAGAAGVAYFFVRIAGKYFGAYAGCALTHTDSGIRNWLGAALIPQAGVSIGLAFLARRILPPDSGNLLVTIILSSSVLYELIGPACAKLALFASGSVEDTGRTVPRIFRLPHPSAHK